MKSNSRIDKIKLQNERLLLKNKKLLSKINGPEDVQTIIKGKTQKVIQNHNSHNVSNSHNTTNIINNHYHINIIENQNIGNNDVSKDEYLKKLETIFNSFGKQETLTLLGKSNTHDLKENKIDDIKKLENKSDLDKIEIIDVINNFVGLNNKEQILRINELYQINEVFAKKILCEAISKEIDFGIKNIGNIYILDPLFTIDIYSEIFKEDITLVYQNFHIIYKLDESWAKNILKSGIKNNSKLVLKHLNHFSIIDNDWIQENFVFLYDADVHDSTFLHILDQLLDYDKDWVKKLVNHKITSHTINFYKYTKLYFQIDEEWAKKLIMKISKDNKTSVIYNLQYILEGQEKWAEFFIYDFFDDNPNLLIENPETFIQNEIEILDNIFLDIIASNKIKSFIKNYLLIKKSKNIVQERKEYYRLNERIEATSK